MKWLSKILLSLLLICVWASGQDEASVPTAKAIENPQTPTVELVKEERTWTREEELYLLEVRQAKLDLAQAKVEMDKASVELEKVQVLYKERLETIVKLNEAQQKYDQAVVDHEKAQIELKKKRLEFLKGATLVAVVDATKSRNDEGQIMAAITLRNDSDINKARVAMEGTEELSDERLAALLKVDNVIVTLLGQVQLTSGVGRNVRITPSGKAIVGDPFRKIVSELEYDQKKVLEYRLLKKDVENVTVRLEFLGIRKDYDVFLRMESQQDLPTISSTQYSQIGQLGSKIMYDLELERLAKTEQSFPLVVLNMPQEIPVSFLDASSKARLTYVKFTEELSKQSLYFQVSIPEKLKKEMVGRSVSFCILVTQRSELKNISELKKRYNNNVPPEEIAKLKGNKVELELISEGVGKLEILIPNLFKEVEQGEPVILKFRVINSGTLGLRRVTPEIDLPLEWEGEVVPAEIEVIEGGEKKLFTVNIRPPEDVAVGEYSVRIKTEGHSGVEIVEALDKDFTIRVASQSNITGTVILVTLLVVLVVGIAIASIKISRR